MLNPIASAASVWPFGKDWILPLTISVIKVPVYITKANNIAPNSGVNSKPPDCKYVPLSFWYRLGRSISYGFCRIKKLIEAIVKNMMRPMILPLSLKL